MEYTDGYKYQLHKSITFQTNLYPTENITTRYIVLLMNGVMTINCGYTWDGPSGPTIDTPDSMTPSLFHDAAYQLMRQGLLDGLNRKLADKWFEEMMLERRSKNSFIRGIQTIRDRIWLRMVRQFAKSASLPQNKKKIHIVK